MDDMETSNSDLNARLAVITGASTGIGFCLATQFLENGFDVLIVSDTEKIEEAARNLPQNGRKIVPFIADLSTHEGNDRLYHKIQEMGRPVDVLAINAGVGVGGEFKDTDLMAEMKIIGLNIMHPVHLSKLVIKDMVSRGQGKILFTSSIAGEMPAPLNSVYAATKAFVTSFTEAIRNELKDKGITVTTLLPGATDTEFFARAGMEGTRVDEGKKDDPMDVARLGFEALMEGKAKVVYGLRNKLQAIVSQILPDSVNAKIHRKQNEHPEESGSEDRRGKVEGSSLA